jgi:hypothetical protein
LVASHAPMRVIPANPGLAPGESRNPVINAVRAFTSAVVYWVPARARPAQPGSLGRDDTPRSTQIFSTSHHHDRNGIDPLIGSATAVLVIWLRLAASGWPAS